MKMTTNKIFEWVKENKKDFIVHAVIYIFFGIIIKLLYDSVLQGPPFEKAVIITLTIIMIALVILMSTLFIFFKRRLKTDDLLNDIYGSTWRNSVYYQRKNHYSEEKYYLSEKLVNDHLPNKLKELDREYHSNGANADKTNINLIIDSGTTLVPLFEYLPLSKIENETKDKLTIFTNNVAGIEELHRSTKDKLRDNERHYYLIGGNPLHTYMATTIDDLVATKNNLNTLLDLHKGVNICIVTSNWILGGAELTELTLCARGRGHFEFKKALVEICDYVIVVAPLGKILRMRDVDALNEIVGEPYQPIPLTIGQGINQETRKDKNKIFLFTTFRERSTLSPLNGHSINLERYTDPRYSPNLKYNLLTPIPKFSPNGSAKEVHLKELPHQYMHDANFQHAYGYQEPH